MKDAATTSSGQPLDVEVLLGYLETAQRMGRIGTWDLDLVGEALFWTDEEYRIFGVSKETELSYEVFLGCVHPDDRELVDSSFKAALSNERPYVIEHRLLVEGEVVWIRQEATIEFDAAGNATRAIGFSQDITEHKLVEERIRQLAMTDQLTGLVNRRQFHHRLAQSMSLADREEKSLALMMLDLDDFKSVNDTYGHPMGDDLLQSVSSIFIRSCRRVDVVARLGGDEFAILLVHPADRLGAGLVAQRILDELSAPMVITGTEIQIGISIGISLYPDDAESEQELIRKADQVLYEVKNAERGTYDLYSRVTTSR